MLGAVYNSGIPNIAAKSVNRCFGFPFFFHILLQFSILTAACIIPAECSDWSVPEQDLARKIAAVTGPGAVAITFENQSTLTKRESEIIENGLRSVLQGLGLRFVDVDQGAASVNITLSENASSYVWVAQIRQGANESSVAIISTPRPEGKTALRDTVPLSLRKTVLWSQNEPILDIAVLEEGQTPTQIAVLDPERISLYRFQGAKWIEERALSITHHRPWPRDLRGRLIPARDRLVDAYLPGVLCSTSSATPLSLNCKESDDPWPLLASTLNSGTMSVFPSAGLGSGAATVVPQMRAFFAPTRNFFTGAITPGIGKFTTVPKFYSAAVLPRDKYMLWLFTTTDGFLHLVDGMNDQAARPGWGSNLAGVRTECGAGWQILATNSDPSQDSVRAYEFPDRDPVAVSAPIDLPGPVIALWTEARGDTAVVVTRNRETGSYEAFRLAIACNQ